MCQRYYQNSFEKGTAPADGVSRTYQTTFTSYDTTGGWCTFVPFQVEMRGAPTVVLYKGATGATNGQWATYGAGGGWISFNSWALNTGSTYAGKGFTFSGSKSSAVFTVGQSWLVDGNWTASAEL